MPPTSRSVEPVEEDVERIRRDRDDDISQDRRVRDRIRVVRRQEVMQDARGRHDAHQLRGVQVLEAGSVVAPLRGPGRHHQVLGIDALGLPAPGSALADDQVPVDDRGRRRVRVGGAENVMRPGGRCGRGCSRLQPAKL
jgi:hypothetical protein